MSFDGKKPAYGIVIDAAGRNPREKIRSLQQSNLEVLQRRPEGGKTPEETSLLETYGETDVLAEVVIGRIPLD